MTVACFDKYETVESSAAQAADLVLKNGYVYTVDPNRSTAQAVAIDDGRIVFVGDNSDAVAFSGPDTVVHDLGGRMLLPGLHDMHIHALGVASSVHPIILWGNDGHHAAANSAALTLAQDQEGNFVGFSNESLAGVFKGFREMVAVDGAGEPTGGVNEAARLLMRPNMMADMMGMSADPADFMPRVAEKLASVGITSIQDPLVGPETLEMYEWLEDNQGMTFRVRTGLFLPSLNSHTDSGLKQIPEHVAAFKEWRQRFDGNPHMQVNAVKLFADGVLEGNPYAKSPNLAGCGGS